MVLFNAGRLPYRKLVSIAKLPELMAVIITPDMVVIGAGSHLLRHQASSNSAGRISFAVSGCWLDRQSG